MPDSAPSFQNRMANAVNGACLAHAVQSPRAQHGAGAEILALGCPRALWFGLNGARPQAAGGLLARAEEHSRLARQLMVRDLRRAGYTVEWLRSLDCGRIHGISRRPHLLEVKAVPETVFQRLKKFGLGAVIDLEIALHCRLAFARLERALFVAENKNTQELYFEKVCFDEEIFKQVRGRAGEVKKMGGAPAGNYDDACLRCAFWRNCREGGGKNSN